MYVSNHVLSVRNGSSAEIPPYLIQETVVGGKREGAGGTVIEASLERHLGTKRTQFGGEAGAESVIDMRICKWACIVPVEQYILMVGISVDNLVDGVSQLPGYSRGYAVEIIGQLEDNQMGL